MSNVYYEKYLKYKSKYISLVNKKKLIENHQNVNLMTDNVRKIMTGGASEILRSNNLHELDNLNLSTIIISKIFTLEADAKKFIEVSTTRLDKTNITSSHVGPHRTETIDVIENVIVRRRLFPDTVTKKETKKVVPLDYIAVFYTKNNDKGKILARELIKEQAELPEEMKYTIKVELA